MAAESYERSSHGLGLKKDDTGVSKSCKEDLGFRVLRVRVLGLGFIV